MRYEGPTPNGGSYAEVYTAEGTAVIVEYTSEGEMIAETFGTYDDEGGKDADVVV
jgi:hypothetical protein